MAATVGLSLGDLIVQTANELRDARQKAGGNPVIQLNSCEIELAVTASSEGGGGIRFWLVDASAKIAREKVSTIKLSFGAVGVQQFPQQADGGPGRVALQKAPR